MARPPATDALGPLLQAPGRTGIFCDFDGTLAPLVPDPDAAVPVAGAVEVLEALAERYARVGIVSGRPLGFLHRFFDGGMYLAGLYGLEWSDGGDRHDHPQAGAWREAVDDVASCSIGRGPEGMRVEPKGLSLTLHYREHPEAADEVRAWADAQAARSGLVARGARMSVELHPPIDADKGTALRQAAADLEAICFLGDDLGDLAAFDALDELGADGVRTLRVAVASGDAVEELVARADLVLDGPADAVELLRGLLA